MTTPPPVDAPATLWNRHFVIWWLGTAQSALGTALASIATSFLVLHQTGSAGAMGVNLALALIPALLSPLFGTLVDRLPLKLPLIAGNLLRAALQLGVGFAALHGEVPLWVIYCASFLTGFIGAFYGPASQGVTPRLVPAEQLQRASGLMQGASQTMQMVGTVGGGALVASIGKGPALLLDGLSFLVFALLLLLVRLPTHTRPNQGERFWTTFQGGLKYVRGRPLLISLPVLALLLNAAFAPVQLLIPVRMEALGAGPQGFGLFFGLVLAGLASGSFLLAGLGQKVSPERASVVGMAGMGLVMLGLALSQSAPQMYVLASLLGLVNALTNVGISVLFQKRVAPEYYGRVGSLLSMVGMAGMPLILLLLAPIADRLTAGVIFGVAGIVGLSGALAWQLILRRESVNFPQPVPA